MANWKKKLDVAEEKLNSAKAVVQSALQEEKHDKHCKDENLDAEKRTKIPVEAALASSKHSLSIARTFLTNLVAKCGGVELPGTLEELRKRQEKLQEQVKDLSASWRERFDGPAVEHIVAEGDQVVKEFESSLQVAIDAEKQIDGSSDEDLVTIIGKVEEAVDSTESLLTYGQAFLEEKMAMAAKFSPTHRDKAMHSLNDIQRRVAEASQRVTDLKNRLVESRKKCGGREAELLVKGAENKVEEAEAALKILDGHTEETDPDDVQNAVQDAAAVQQEVDVAIVKAMRIAEGMEESEAKEGILARLIKLDEQLVEQRRILTEREHSFVAKRMRGQIGAKVGEATKALQAALDVAASLVTSKDNFVVVSAIGHIVEALRRFVTTEKKSTWDIFEDMIKKADSDDRNGKGNASPSQFVSYLQEEIPEMKGMPTLRFSNEELVLVFKHIDENGNGFISAEDFAKQFQKEYKCVKEVSMTEALAVEGKPMRKLALGEVVTGLQGPEKDMKTGLERVRVRANDAEEGWVTISGNQGTIFMKPVSPFDRSVQQAEKGLVESQKEIEKTTSDITAKVESLDGIEEGPLVEARKELIKMLEQLQEAHVKCEKTKKALANSQAARTVRLKAEARWEVEKQDYQAASEMVDPCLKEMEELEKEVDDIQRFSEKLSIDCQNDDCPLDIDQVEVRARAADQNIALLGKTINENITKCKAASEGPLLEAKSKLIKLKMKVAPVTTKCRNSAEIVSTASKSAKAAANAALLDALQVHLQVKKLSADTFFEELGPVEVADDANQPELGPRIPVTKLEKVASGLKGLSSKTLSFALQRFVDKGVPKSWICTGLTEYRVCVKEIAVTNTQDVAKGSRTLRKLKVGEILEILEMPLTCDDAAQMNRVRARAVSDSIEGWVTVKGNQGTVFLEAALKPYLILGKDGPLRAEPESDSNLVRSLTKNEVLEVLEGPRQEAVSQNKRAKGQLGDGSVGWVTFSVEKGVEHFSSAKDVVLQAKQHTVVMDDQDVRKGKILRKIEPGEVVLILEGPAQDSENGIVRARGRCLKDRLEGWVTVKGNQGTVYLEVNDRYYLCTNEKGISLQAEIGSDSAEVHLIQKGDFFHLTEGPKLEPHTAKERVKVVALKDGATGWLTLQEAKATNWTDPGM